jgi:OOP family OmpA-OmpF porin
LGSASSNLTLSGKRAIAVKKYLYEIGISFNRMTNDGMGELQPISSNETEEGKALNRRVEFRFKY